MEWVIGFTCFFAGFLIASLLVAWDFIKSEKRNAETISRLRATNGKLQQIAIDAQKENAELRSKIAAILDLAKGES